MNNETYRYTAHHYPRTGEPPMSYRYVLTAPLIIGPRLMPALQLDDRSTLHLEFAGSDDEGRCTTRLVIDDADGATIYDGTGPSSGCDADPDIRDMFAAACDFLAAEAETYRVDMGTREPDDGWLFNARVAEWAYMHDDELQLAALDLEDDDDMGAATVDYLHRAPVGNATPGSKFKRGEIVALRTTRQDFYNDERGMVESVEWQLWEVASVSRDGLEIRRARQWSTFVTGHHRGTEEDWTRVVQRGGWKHRPKLYRIGAVDLGKLAAALDALDWPAWHAARQDGNAFRDLVRGATP